MQAIVNCYLKKATREIERSSCGVREDAKMERRTAGVTGIRREESDGGCRGVGLAVVVVPLVEDEGKDEGIPFTRLRAVRDGSKHDHKPDQNASTLVNMCLLRDPPQIQILRPCVPLSRSGIAAREKYRPKGREFGKGISKFAREGSLDSGRLK